MSKIFKVHRESLEGFSASKSDLHFFFLATPPKIVAPHRQATHWRLITRAAGPAGTCDVRGVMLHLGPGASRKRVPPSPDVPSGNTLGSITRAVTSALRPVQLPRQPHVRLVITRILRPLPPHTARRAAVPACPRFRSASPPPASPSTPSQRCSAPRPAASCLPFVCHSLAHHASGLLAGVPQPS